MTTAASWSAARLAAYELGASVRTPAEPVGVGDSPGRVLATDVRALVDLPSFDTSAMDGWAVRGRGPWTVEGDSLAGRPWEGELAEASAVRIATGGRVPVGATAILRREDADEGSVRIAERRPPRAADIRRRGEECAEGDILARGGEIVTPAMAGLVAASGHDAVSVAARPTTAAIVFGDELAFGGLPGPSGVRDALGPQLPAWIRGIGGLAVPVGRARDTLGDHVDAIAAAVAGADVVVTTGGTASGPADHLHAALAAIDARVIVDGVAVRPGFPMLLASGVDPGRRTVPIVALPGNPMSAIVGVATLLWPLIAGALGQALPALGRTWLASSLDTRPPAHRLVAGCLDESGVFAPVEHLGSSMLRGLARARGFAVLPPERAEAGDEVLWQPLPPFAGGGTS